MSDYPPPPPPRKVVRPMGPVIEPDHDHDHDHEEEATITPRHEPEVRPKPVAEAGKVQEIGGRDGPEPTRYGDWENKGIASDF